MTDTLFGRPIVYVDTKAPPVKFGPREVRIPLKAYFTPDGVVQLSMKRILPMTQLASLISQFGTQLSTYQGDQTNVSTDQSAVTAAQQKLSTDQGTEGNDLTALQTTLDAINTEAVSLGLKVNVPAPAAS